MSNSTLDDYITLAKSVLSGYAARSKWRPHRVATALRADRRSTKGLEP